MQSVFFVALFSLVFLMFSSLTAGMSRNIMQENMAKIEETKKMFADIETALTLVAYKEKDSTGKSIVDLTEPDLTDLGGEFISAHTSYTTQQLEKDPWRKKVYLLKNTKQETIWGASGGQYAKAPITTFLLVSAGPNGQYDMFNTLGLNLSNPTATVGQMNMTDITDKSVIGDDIVVRFSNYDAMLDIWQRAESLDKMVKNIAVSYYSSLLDAFSPLIQLSQRDVRYGQLDENIFDSINLGNVYTGFDSFDNDSSGNIADDWQDSTTDIYKILAGGTATDGTVYSGFRVAKVYNEEFELDSNPAENNRKNQEFKNKYPEEFLYPSFDIIIKDDNGNTLPLNQQGLQNIGVTNIDSLDPFAGGGTTDGVLDYSYDDNNPETLTLIRDFSGSNPEEWDINKQEEININ